MQKNKKKKLRKYEVISCSRRTDIPAFLMEWVLNKIHQGYVDVANPFNKKQITRVSLKPESVKCWCWWSKDFSKWIKYYKSKKTLFQNYKGHYFQFTINSPSELEPQLRTSLDERLDQLKWLIEEFSPLAVNYRFDPIILYRKKASSQIKSNLNKFEYIITQMAHFGVKEIIFSFATLYSKVKRRMKARGYIPVKLSLDGKKEILQKLLKICRKHHLEMKACCQPELLELDLPGLSQAHCIDAYKIEKIVGEFISKAQDSGQRDACGCHKSKDIGGYQGIFRCKHNCSYCYANPRKV
jgi:hypothetical protein